MHEHALHREIDSLRQRQLAAARHIEAEAVRIHEATDRLVQERLRSIDDIGIGIARSERIAIGFHAILKVCLVVHVERRAEFFGNFHHIHATDMKMAINDLGGHRQAFAQFHSGEIIRFDIMLWCWKRHGSPFFRASLDMLVI